VIENSLLAAGKFPARVAGNFSPPLELPRESRAQVPADGEICRIPC
jgi:hypothetical protein